MRRQRLGAIGTAISFAVGAILASLACSGHGGPTPRQQSLRQIRLALFAYQAKHGSLPVDAKGPEAALYRLGPYAPADQFNVPGQSVAPDGAWYDDAAQKLQAGGYCYLNKEARLDNRAGPEAICVMAENRIDPNGGVYALFNNGRVEFIDLKRLKKADPTAILGQPYSLLSSAD